MLDSKPSYDVIILGAGAAGLMCALTAAERGRRVLLIESSNKPGKKILMSGGGRCNFTNLDVQPHHFICANPHFVKSALTQYSQHDFISLVERHNIPYHDKGHGQLFCDRSSKDILNILLKGCLDKGVELLTDCVTKAVSFDQGFHLETNKGAFYTENLVVATGGLSIPTLGGATGFGYKLASQFGLQINPTDASLVPFTLSGKWRDLSSSLAGVSIPVVASVTAKAFSEQMLFTHRGLSGPGILQLSNYWRLGEEISIDLLPNLELKAELITYKKNKPNTTISHFLNGRLPKSVVQALGRLHWPDEAEKSLHEYKNEDFDDLVSKLKCWKLRPSGTEGYRTAEVTRGGVDVSGISSKSMRVKHMDGLYFIGEVLDVTGHLGGYNFQWAWSSAYVAGIDV